MTSKNIVIICFVSLCILTISLKNVHSRIIIGEGGVSTNMPGLSYVLTDPAQAAVFATTPLALASTVDHTAGQRVSISAFDQNSMLTYTVTVDYRTNLGILHTYDASSQQELYAVTVQNTIEALTYDYENQILYALVYHPQLLVYYIASIDPTTGIISDKIIILKGVISIVPGLAAFDHITKNFYCITINHSQQTLLWTINVISQSTSFVPLLATLTSMQWDDNSKILVGVGFFRQLYWFTEIDPTTGTCNRLGQVPEDQQVIMYGAVYDSLNGVLVVGTFGGNDIYSQVPNFIDFDRNGKTIIGKPQPQFSTALDNLSDFNTKFVQLQSILAVDENDSLLTNGNVLIKNVDKNNNIGLMITVTVSVTQGSVYIFDTSANAVNPPPISSRNRSLTMTGTINQINSYLTFLTYISDLYYHGADQMTYVVRDASYGNQIMTMISDTKTVALVVNGVNNPPVINNVASTYTLATKCSVLTLSQLTITDVDAGETNPNLFTTTVTSPYGRITLSDDSGITYAAGSRNGLSMIQFTSTLTGLNNAISNLQYKLFNPSAFQGKTDTLTILTDDGGSTGKYGSKQATVTTTITFTETNVVATDVVMFNGDGSSIHIGFCESTNKASITTSSTCSGMFTADSLTAFGTGAICEFTDDKNLLIHMGTAPTIVAWAPGTTLTILNQVTFLSTGLVLTGLNQQPFQVSHSIGVLTPTSPSIPVALYSGNTNIDFCQGVSIDMSSSVGSGGRNFVSIIWSVQNPTSFPGISSALTSASTNNLQQVTLTPDLLVPGGAWIISLQVVNFLGTKSLVTQIAVSKSSQPIPKVSIDGPTILTTTRNNPITFNGIATPSACSSSIQTTFTYTWTSIGSTLFTIDPSVATSTQLYVPANTLTAGLTYSVQFIATVPGSTTSASATVQIVVQQQPLTVSLGGNRSYYLSNTLVIDGSSATDPDINSAAGISFVWQCREIVGSTEPACDPKIDAILSTSTTSATFPFGSGFVDAKIYRLRLTILKGTGNNIRTATSATYITASANQIIPLGFTTSIRIIVSEKNILLTPISSNTLYDSTNLIYTWTAQTVEDNPESGVLLKAGVLVSAASASYLEVRTSLLTQGKIYRFTCSVKSGAISGFATQDIQIAESPFGGKFSISPATGVAAITQFTLSSTGWQSPSGGALTYTFGDTSGSFEQKSGSSLSTKLTQPSSTVSPKVFVTITDVGTGAIATLSNTVILTVPSLLQQASAISSLQNSVATLLSQGSTAAAMNEIKVISSTFVGSSATSTTTNLLIQQMLLVMAKQSSVVTPATTDSELTTLAAIASSGPLLTADAASASLMTLNSFGKAAGSVSTTTALKSLAIVELNLSSSATATSATDQKSASQNAVNILNNILSAISSTITPNTSTQIISSASQSTALQVVTGKVLNNSYAISGKSTSRRLLLAVTAPATVTFPTGINALANPPLTDTSVLTTTLTDSKTNPYTLAAFASKLRSNVYTFQVNNLGTAVQFSQLTAPNLITINIPLQTSFTNTDNFLACLMYNTGAGQFLQNFCAVTSPTTASNKISGQIITCQCSGTGTVAVGELTLADVQSAAAPPSPGVPTPAAVAPTPAPGASSSSSSNGFPTWAIYVISIGGAALVAGVLVIAFFAYRSQKRSKEQSEAAVAAVVAANEVRDACNAASGNLGKKQVSFRYSHDGTLMMHTDVPVALVEDKSKEKDPITGEYPLRIVPVAPTVDQQHNQQSAGPVLLDPVVDIEQGSHGNQVLLNAVTVSGSQGILANEAVTAGETPHDDESVEVESQFERGVLASKAEDIENGDTESLDAEEKELETRINELDLRLEKFRSIRHSGSDVVEYDEAPLQASSSKTDVKAVSHEEQLSEFLAHSKLQSLRSLYNRRKNSDATSPRNDSAKPVKGFTTEDDFDLVDDNEYGSKERS